MRKRSLLSSFAVAALLGVGFGVTSYSVRADEAPCETYTEIEGPGAQDTNHDGIATVAEGRVDLNGDGKFGEFEAQFYGMTCFICWQVTHNCGVIANPQPAAEAKKDVICLYHTGGKYWNCSTETYAAQWCLAAADGSSCQSGLGQ